MEIKAMFFGQFERECLFGEFWLIEEKNKLPEHLQRLVEQEQQEEVIRDIWEWEPENLSNDSIAFSSDKNSHHSTTTNIS
jgi:hypothetical protein